MVKYTEEEFKEIKEKINSITNMIPSSLATWVWNTYKDITGSRNHNPALVEVQVTCGERQQKQ